MLHIDPFKNVLNVFYAELKTNIYFCVSNWYEHSYFTTTWGGCKHNTDILFKKNCYGNQLVNIFISCISFFRFLQKEVSV